MIQTLVLLSPLFFRCFVCSVHVIPFILTLCIPLSLAAPRTTKSNIEVLVDDSKGALIPGDFGKKVCHSKKTPTIQTYMCLRYKTCDYCCIYTHQPFYSKKILNYLIFLFYSFRDLRPQSLLSKCGSPERRGSTGFLARGLFSQASRYKS
jgi:hypothetical protein